jgi:hypothetical protein
VDLGKEKDEFRRIRLGVKVDREEGLITMYHEHIRFYRDRLNKYHHLLGRIGVQLGDSEPEEPA